MWLRKDLDATGNDQYSRSLCFLTIFERLKKGCFTSYTEFSECNVLSKCIININKLSFYGVRLF